MIFEVLLLCLAIVAPVVLFKLNLYLFERRNEKRRKSNYERNPIYRSTMVRRKDGRGVIGGMAKVDYNNLSDRDKSFYD